MLPVALAFFSFTHFLMSKRWLMPEDKGIAASVLVSSSLSQITLVITFVLPYLEVKGGDSFAVKMYYPRDALKFRPLQKLNTRKPQKTTQERA